ncbi:DUF7344 domain-containing protein [Haloarcula salina]|uniref:DUF7344 domain-containing protein n=1 Tax=Haloarcula salina TaxID=1429914 RepID=A0AA41G064_9EURY|nr:hypothetical protein [Haloarcula salina]MBV0901109.1 hypothetical protein [Haloarcula salina]
MATTSTSDASDLPEEVVSDLLGDEHRRRALSIMAARGEPMVVADLAAAILAVKREVDPDAVPDADRRALAEELYTEHLPKLTATGVVSYDSVVGKVELRRPDAVPTDQL